MSHSHARFRQTQQPTFSRRRLLKLAGATAVAVTASRLDGALPGSVDVSSQSAEAAIRTTAEEERSSAYWAYRPLPYPELPQAMNDLWNKTDGPVYDLRVERSWFWGPLPRTALVQEEYAEAPGGFRDVAYFDKSRMEITQPGGDPKSEWYVTNGLLAHELVTGAVQLGDKFFDQRAPAPVIVAGDFNDINAPTFASFTKLVAAIGQLAVGTAVNAQIDVKGIVTVGSSANGVTIVGYAKETGHNLPDVFMKFLNQSGVIYDRNGNLVTGPLQSNPFYATGFPITEPYWTNILLGGTKKQVLVQLYERRVLTYTPSNDPNWQVEASNVGLQYYEYRYGQLPDSIITDNVKRDFVTHAGNGWEIDDAKDLAFYLVPNGTVGEQNLDKLPDMLTALDSSFKGKRFRLALGTSKDQLANDFGVPIGQFLKIPYTGQTAFIGEAPFTDTTGAVLPGTCVISLYSDVLTRVANDVAGLNKALIKFGVMQLFGQRMITKHPAAVDTISAYIAANTIIIQ